MCASVASWSNASRSMNHLCGGGKQTSVFTGVSTTWSKVWWGGCVLGCSRLFHVPTRKGWRQTLYNRCRGCLYLQQAICGSVALLWGLAALPWAHMEGLIQRISKYRHNQDNELPWSGRSCSSVARLAVRMHQRESAHLKFSVISAGSLEVVDRLFSISSYLFVFFSIANQINLERIN